MMSTQFGIFHGITIWSEAKWVNSDADVYTVRLRAGAAEETAVTWSDILHVTL